MTVIASNAGPLSGGYPRNDICQGCHCEKRAARRAVRDAAIGPWTRIDAASPDARLQRERRLRPIAAALPPVVPRNDTLLYVFKRRALLAAVVFLCLSGSRCGRRAERRAATAQPAVLRPGWETIRDTHWDPETVGAGWSAAREELRPRAASAESMTEAREVLQELVGRLGHPLRHHLRGSLQRSGAGGRPCLGGRRYHQSISGSWGARQSWSRCWPGRLPTAPA